MNLFTYLSIMKDSVLKTCRSKFTTLWYQVNFKELIPPLFAVFVFTPLF